jgi:hypothetical protein
VSRRGGPPRPSITVPFTSAMGRGTEGAAVVGAIPVHSKALTPKLNRSIDPIETIAVLLTVSPGDESNVSTGWPQMTIRSISSSEIVGRPIVEFRRFRQRVRGNLLRVLEGPAGVVGPPPAAAGQPSPASSPYRSCSRNRCADRHTAPRR